MNEKKDQRPKTTKGLSLRDRDADESVSRAESELQKRAVPTIEMGAVLLRVRGFIVQVYSSASLI